MDEDPESCPWCDADIPIVLGFETLGNTINCPKCGKPCEVEGDYCGEDSWYFALVRAYE